MDRQGRGKAKKKRTGLVVLCVVAAVLAACAAVYFLVFDSLVFVTDSAYSAVIPVKDMLILRLNCALKGIRLHVVRIKDSVYEYPAMFAPELAGLKGDYVLLTPVAAATALDSGTDVSALLPDSVVIAIGPESGRVAFDVTLVSDDASGWKAAAAKVASELSPMSQNAALVYDSSVNFDIRNITEAFASGRLSVFHNDGSKRLFNSETATALASQSIVVALCPHLTGLADMVRSASTVSWIVDYRFRNAVPADNLYGVVAPDFKSVPGMLKDMQKGSRTTMELGYVYEKK